MQVTTDTLYVLFILPIGWVILGFLKAKIGYWSLFVKRYPAIEKPSGTSYGRLSLYSGVTKYEGNIFAIVSSDKITFSLDNYPIPVLFHPPFSLPRDVIRCVKKDSLLGCPRVTFRIEYGIEIMLLGYIADSEFWDNLPEM